MAQEFKPGQLVICIDADWLVKGTPLLVKGEYYKIARLGGSKDNWKGIDFQLLMLEINGKEVGGLRRDRFRAATGDGGGNEA